MERNVFCEIAPCTVVIPRAEYECLIRIAERYSAINRMYKKAKNERHNYLEVDKVEVVMGESVHHPDNKIAKESEE